MATAVDVDELWESMKDENLPKRKVAAKAKKSPMDISALQREKKKVPKKSVKQLDSSLKWMQSWSASIRVDKSLSPRDRKGTNAADVEEDPLALQETPLTLIDGLDDIPKDTPDTFIAHLQRDINCLAEDAVIVRQQSLQKLHKVLVTHIDTLSTDLVDAALDALLKPLLKRMKDKSEKCRELSIIILRTLLENTSEVGTSMPYVFPSLVGRLGCEDLDGVAHLPEVARPAPEQKPTQILKPVEDSEEVRLELAKLVRSFFMRCNQAQILSYIDEATGILRGQNMDPFPAVKMMALETMASFCYNHSEMLLHFTEPMGRSLTSCLTHQHAKLRIQALKTLIAVMWCGLWKHNHEVIQMLVAWQDPNQVQIQAFYENVTKVNYMSMLTFDRHPAVRRFWFETIAYILLRIPDKVDHEPNLFPYILSGLSDENEDIALETFWLIERMGQLYEEEHETDIRKDKQYGFDYFWTYSGRAFVPFPLQAKWAGGKPNAHIRRTGAYGPDHMGEIERAGHKVRDEYDLDGMDGEVDKGEIMELPVRDYAWRELDDIVCYRNMPRPRMGSRYWVRTHVRKFIKATFNDVVDFRDCTAANAGKLLCMCCAYGEEGITEWLQPLFASLIKFFSGRAAAAGSSDVKEVFEVVCKLLGAFLDPKSYWEQLRSAFDSDTVMSVNDRMGCIHVLRYCIEGSVEALLSVPDDPTLGCGHLNPVIPELISAFHGSDILLDITAAGRQELWELLFSFVEPLHDELSFEQVSQLLCISLALSAKQPSNLPPDRAGHAIGDAALNFEEEEWEDLDSFMKAVTILSSCKSAKDQGSLDADSADVLWKTVGSAETRGIPAFERQGLMHRAFVEMMEFVGDNFPIFRAIVYSVPVPVLLNSQHSGLVLQKLNEFAGEQQSPSVRIMAHALGVYLVKKISALFDHSAFGDSPIPNSIIQTFAYSVFKVLGESQKDFSTENCQYIVLIAALDLWHRFFLLPAPCPSRVLFPSGGGASPQLQWLASVMAEQELYKKMHKALDRVERTHTGKEDEDFTIHKTKQIREDAEERANRARLLAATNLLLILRRMLHSAPTGIPWAKGDKPGSARAMFKSITSLFHTQKPTMDPPFVRPTGPALMMYVCSLARLFFHRRGELPPFFVLRDDAAKGILDLQGRDQVPYPNFELDEKETENVVMGLVNAIMELNLSLPPNPGMKNIPTTLGESHEGAILLGWDGGLTGSVGSLDGLDDGSESCPSSATSSGKDWIPREVARVLQQSMDCLKWNAALALYCCAIDMSVVYAQSFQKGLAFWQKRREQGKVLVTQDILKRTVKSVGNFLASAQQKSGAQQMGGYPAQKSIGA
eukprot:gnl/MRDRNA2_/MRDRNA2_81112_c0_seq1.p1 gnl/MRDRNA2_/MRDRNA2_81112_c0~~gnl/MRDRNA2_/MRDRNA2_81112_c0_seq1.p1  ORF type:complete len:1338 (-),score=253.26 gnl/MRDRNA2_/MRDRNA2_81112_c0_seq1:78-4091(-)